jgi:hypothetical protein
MIRNIEKVQEAGVEAEIDDNIISEINKNKTKMI